MRGDYEHFLKLVDKKPSIKAIVGKIQSFTDISQIDSLTDVELRPWMVKHLKTMWKYTVNNSLTPEEIANLMWKKTYAEYLVDDFELYDSGCNITVGKLSYDIECGEPILKLSSDTIKVGSTVLRLTETAVAGILNRSFKIGKGTHRDHNIRLQNYLTTKHGNAEAKILGDYTLSGIMSSVRYS